MLPTYIQNRGPFMLALTSPPPIAGLRHRALLETEKKQDTFIWEETLLCPFNELIISWNAQRPRQGSYLIQVSLFTTEWSPWFDYAFWSRHDQYSFKKHLPEKCIEINQDTIEILEGNKADGFKIRLTAQEKTSLADFKSLYTSAIDRSTHAVSAAACENVFLNLKMDGLSQIALPDERRLRVCSPTSTAAVIHFLSNSSEPSPLEFANAVIDSAFDQYGNWVLNTAQAYEILGKSWNCFVARLTTFDQIIDQLRKGYPVIVSVQGPLHGGALAYQSGHLLVVKGYDSETREVFCMDPAFPTNELTLVKYALSDFLIAWSRRQGTAYLFNR